MKRTSAGLTAQRRFEKRKLQSRLFVVALVCVLTSAVHAAPSQPAGEPAVAVSAPADTASGSREAVKLYGTEKPKAASGAGVKGSEGKQGASGSGTGGGAKSSSPTGTGATGTPAASGVTPASRPGQPTLPSRLGGMATTTAPGTAATKSSAAGATSGKGESVHQAGNSKVDHSKGSDAKGGTSKSDHSKSSDAKGGASKVDHSKSSDTKSSDTKGSDTKGSSSRGDHTKGSGTTAGGSTSAGQTPANWSAGTTQPVARPGQPTLPKAFNPGAAVAISPSNTTVSGAVEFKWKQMSHPDLQAYEITVMDQQGRQQKLFIAARDVRCSQGVCSFSFKNDLKQGVKLTQPLAGKPATVYSWTVSAVSTGGARSVQSPAFSFAVK